MDIGQLKKSLEDKAKKSVDVLADKLKGIRSGTASPALIENIKVDYYGTPTPLKQVASINTPDPRQLMVKPFDQTLLPIIEKAIIASNIGLTPANDGKVIRLNIPSLSEERRGQLADQVKKMGEEAKVSIRNIRRDAMKDLDTLLKDKKVSEDVHKREKDAIQKQIDIYDKKVDQIVEAKNKEIKQ